MKHRHVHGGPTKKSPPDAVVLVNSSDSISLRVSARPIKSKNCLAGPLVPFFPVFLSPARNYYKDEPEMLEIRVAVCSILPVNILADSLTLVFEDSVYPPFKAMRKRTRGSEEFSNLILPANSEEIDVLYYPYSYHEYPDQLFFQFKIIANTANKFRLHLNCFQVNSKKLNFPEIVFEKKKQTWFFVGP